MTEKYGVRKVFGLGLFTCGLFCCLSPLAAKLNVWTFMALRMVQGACEGVTFPALQAMTARWIPLKERSSFIARTYFGTVFGLVITFPLCGFIIDRYGWEAAFYVIGAITTVWFVFWWFLVHDSPDQHPRISEQELARIKVSCLKITYL